MEIKRKIKQTIENLKYKFWHSRLAWYDDSHEIKLTSLSPSENIEDNDSNIDAYEIALRNVLKSTEANNIAMTGDLGIGKSSILKTYERRNNEKFIYVSVSDLIDDSQPPEKKKTPGEKKKIQEEIEKNLLKQLIAICRKKDIPASRFRNIPEAPSGFKNTAYAFLIAVCALALGIVLLWNQITKAITVDSLQIFGEIGFNTSKITDESLTEILAYAKLISYAILIVSLFILSIVSAYKIIRHYKLPKISAKAAAANGSEAGVEFNTAIDPESLDKNLEEIIYLMERVGKKSGNVLVIEDMDRFPADVCFPVLVKLKQINMMVNQRIRFKKFGRSFKFIYALKEDFFSGSDKDPYKFFDVLIPIVPTLSSKSSTFYLNKNWEKYNFIPGFISNIAPHLTDYRRIFNIENEYTIFSEVHKKFFDRIEDETINQELRTELMALIVYKVHYPEDYYEIRHETMNGSYQSLLAEKLHDTWTLPEDIKPNPDDDLIDILACYMTQRVFHFIGACAFSAVEQAKTQYEYAVDFNKNTDDKIAVVNILKCASEIEEILKKMGNKNLYPDTMPIVMDYYARTIALIFNYESPYELNKVYDKMYLLFMQYTKPNFIVYEPLLMIIYKIMKFNSCITADVIEELLELKSGILRNFDFCDANLSDINFTIIPCITLKGSIYNSNTIFPKGFDPKAHGMIDISAQPEPETEPETNDSESTAPIT